MNKNMDMVEGYVIHGFTRDSEGEVRSFCYPTLFRDRNTAMRGISEILDCEARDLYDSFGLESLTEQDGDRGELWIENDAYYMRLEVQELRYE